MKIVVQMTLNGLRIDVDEGMTILEAARFYGMNIPTLCYLEGLSPYGACRLCLVEIGMPGQSKLVTSCTYRVEEGLVVRTDSEWVIKRRKMLIELYLATCPSSKVIQTWHQNMLLQFALPLARRLYSLRALCAHVCRTDAGKGYRVRPPGSNRRLQRRLIRNRGMPFMGGCMYVCPACQSRCQGPQEEQPVCNACLNLQQPCLEYFEDKMCFMDPCVACELDANREVKAKRRP